MAVTVLSPDLTSVASGSGSERLERRLFWVLAAAALIYAFLAGLRTLTDYDLFWQMATGRWVVQHHTVSSVDVFSYTAAGREWIYPVGSGILFYLTYLAGGYALLSWLGALACISTVALILRRGHAITAGIAIFAVARIAARTTPRADMFTVVLFAAFLSILWEQYKTGRARLWLLPVLMAAWVNFHLGCIAGLGLVAAYVAIETLGIFTLDRVTAIAHLKRAWPWLAGTVAATLLNPWGWTLYSALYRQESAMRLHSEWITEWRSAHLGLQSLGEAVALRNPESSLYVLLLIAVLAAVIAIIQRQFGAALLLTTAAYEGIRHVRMQALFACVVVVIGGAVLSSTVELFSSRVSDSRMRAILASGAAALLLLLTVVRSADLVSNRRYFGSTDTGNFGAGLSWWFPQRAAHFIERESLPPEIFNVYNEGGFVAWELGPKYRDFIDGRAIPFGPSGFDQHEALLHSRPSSPEWREQVAAYNVNLILVPLGRYDGIQYFPYLTDFCTSQDWAPVYLDEVSGAFVRRGSMPESVLQKLQVNCFTAPIPSLPNRPGGADAFNAWANASSVLATLGRNSEALNAANNALAIYPESAVVRFIRGNLLAGMGRLPQAETDYLISVQQEATDVTWMALAQLYRSQGKLLPATQALEEAVNVSRTPYNALLELAAAYMQAQRPKDTLRILDEAERNAPPAAASRDLYLASVAEGRSAAWNALGNPARAISFMEQSVRLAPDDAERWRQLANLYAAQGREADAQRAGQRAAALAGSVPN